MRPLLHRTLLLVCLIGYPVAGLLPFSFQSPVSRNRAAHLPGGGLSFTGVGLARTPAPPEWAVHARATGRLELRLRVRPARADQTGPARILSLSRDHYTRNLTLAQDGDALVMRLRTSGSTEGGMPERRLSAALTPEAWTEVILQIEPGRVRLQTDAQAWTGPLAVAGALAPWDTSMPLLLGNEGTGDRPWEGTIARAEARTPAGTVDVLAPAALDIPRLVWHLHRPPKLVPFRNTQPHDAVVNLLGFMPLGALVGFGRSRRWPTAVLVAGGVSLGIELLQFLLPARVPSVTDLILNTAGGVLGFALARAVIARFTRSDRTQHANRVA